MKIKYLSLVIVFLAATLISCKKNDTSNKRDFERSYQAWLNFKSESNNSYSYITTESSWTGFSSETTITIRNGEIVGRSFVMTKYDYEANEVKILDQWEENEEQLNTHETYSVSQTLDQIYELAKTKWLIKNDDVDTYFEANNNGMISQCGYVPRNCMDDCFIGIKIKSITKL